MKNRIKTVICVFTAVIILICICYVNDYYRASEGVTDALEATYYLEEDILVFEPDSTENGIKNAGGSKCGIIFYPGGKVEYTAYAPLMRSCAEEGILCVLIHMPWNLAVFDIDAADGIQERFPEVEEWYMAGHSLGGSMAASYVSDNTEKYEGLILLASYSTADLSESGLEILSVYGTEDKVLNKEKYNEYEPNLPKDYEEEIIKGGCHAYFGNYGEQEGDGDAKISVEKQQEITLEVIKKFVK